MIGCDNWAIDMRIGIAVNTFSWNDMNSTAREYILMTNDVRDVQYRKQ